MLLTLLKSTPAVGNTMYLKVSGTWKPATVWIKVSGTWKQATPNIKVSGTWR